MRSTIIGILLAFLMGIEAVKRGRGERERTTTLFTEAVSNFETNINSLTEKIRKFKNENLFTSYLDQETRNKVVDKLNQQENAINSFKSKTEETRASSLTSSDNEYAMIDKDLDQSLDTIRQLIDRNKTTYNYHKSIIALIKQIKERLIEYATKSNNNFDTQNQAIKKHLFGKIKDSSQNTIILDTINSYHESIKTDLVDKLSSILRKLDLEKEGMVDNLSERNEALKQYIRTLNVSNNQNGLEFRITLLILLLQRSLSKDDRNARKNKIAELINIRNNIKNKTSVIQDIDDIINGILKNQTLMPDDQTNIINIIQNIWCIKYPNTTNTFPENRDREKNPNWYTKEITDDTINSIIGSIPLRKKLSN